MITIENNLPVYQGDTFKIVLTRYTDPQRLNAARNAARYLGKADIDNVRRPLSIIRQGHVPEIFRGEFAEFEFHDVSKEVYDHIITYTTRNMRVAGGNRALTSDSYTMPSDKMKDPNYVQGAIEQSISAYKSALLSGETPQVARAAMPTAAKLNIFVYQFNFLSLGQAVFKQRIWEKGAQGNTVKVIQGMYELCKHMDEELWNTFFEWHGTPSTEWTEVRRKLKKKKYNVRDLINILQEFNSDDDAEWAIRESFGHQKSMW